MTPLRRRAVEFLQRSCPFGRTRGNSYDELLARYASGLLADLPDTSKQLDTFVELTEAILAGLQGEREAYTRELLEILREIRAETAAGMTPPSDRGGSIVDVEVRKEGSDLEASISREQWKAFLPQEEPPRYVHRPVNEHETRLLALLRAALDEYPEAAIRKFEDYYWALPQQSIPRDTELGNALHEFASDLEYFELKEERRRGSSILYGPDELQRIICHILAL